MAISSKAQKPDKTNARFLMEPQSAVLVKALGQSLARLQAEATEVQKALRNLAERKLVQEGLDLNGWSGRFDQRGDHVYLIAYPTPPPTEDTGEEP